MVHRFTLCADDFALTEGVSRSILELLGAQKISAAGAMTNRPHWQRLAGAFGALAGRADLGLHLNLTCASPLGPMPVLAPDGVLPSPGRVARAALLSRESRTEIAAEIGRQFDAFEDGLGRGPDFVDGHQHVHVLPHVRDAVMRAIAARYPAGTVWLRDPADTIDAIRARGVATGKALVIAGLATGLARAAERRGIPVNQGFSGVSPFDATRDFGADLTRFLIRPGPAHLVMCHPGHIDAELARLDPVVATRPIEHAALAAFEPPAGFKMTRMRP